MKQKTNEHLHTSSGANDECYTYSYAVEPLLEYLERFRGKIIWCPFDTEESEYVKVFKAHGHKVVYSHIEYGQDFYKYEPEEWDILITNPAFSNKTEMFKRVISFGKPFAILMNITYLNDGTAAKVFKDIDLQILSFDKRMEFKNQPVDKKINFLSAYFCSNFLPEDLGVNSKIVFSDFRNRNQLNLFNNASVNELAAKTLIADPTSELFQDIERVHIKNEIQKISKELWK